VKKCVEVALHDAAADSILALDVTDAKGLCLMPAGTMLTRKILTRLAARGVKSVSIYRDETSTPEQRQGRREEIARQLEQRFRRVADEPLMKQLKASLLKYRIGNI
jgi:hypothetical protein